MQPGSHLSSILSKVARFIATCDGNIDDAVAKKCFGQSRRFFADRVSISERPKIIEQRLRVGGWEADLMLGKPGKGALVTCLERKSRYLLAVQVVGKSAKASIRPWKPSWLVFPSHCGVR
ncbi:hypothetical protein [Geothermobacter ehrlichii]|uniref:hypothetical protein n=1 Tax=Geothermobacter ehrlichii TaxID=213224 RepID=UPI0011E6C968|nr:hypothetical protein [Geothermobacter ehrlichii]